MEKISELGFVVKRPSEVNIGGRNREQYVQPSSYHGGIENNLGFQINDSTNRFSLSRSPN